MGEEDRKVTSIRNDYNGLYVTAELGRTGVDYGMLRARNADVSTWEKFRIDRWGPNPNMYTIRSNVTGKYVSTEMGYTGGRHAMLRARATEVGNWEKYIIPCGLPYVCSF